MSIQEIKDLIKQMKAEMTQPKNTNQLTSEKYKLIKIIEELLSNPTQDY